MTAGRRDKGTGSVFQRVNDGRWVGTIELPSAGKRRRKQVTAKTRDGVMRKLREERARLAATGDLVTSAPTVEKWLTRWITTGARERFAPGTTRTYRSRLSNDIAPYIGRVRVDKLTPAHIVVMHDAIADAGREPRHADALLRAAMREAYRLGLTQTDVMRRVRRPSGHDRALSGALDAEQARILLRSVADDPAALARWSVALFTGMRQGEVLGLTRDAVDLAAGTLTVEWQLQRLDWGHGHPDTLPCEIAAKCPDRFLIVPEKFEARILDGAAALVRPKSARSRRVVPLAPPVAEALDKHLRSSDGGPHGLVFARVDGSPEMAYTDRYAWQDTLRAAGLPAVNLHSARHTCATLLGALGIPEQVRMQIMGHSSAAVQRVYADVTDGMAAAAAQALGQLLAIESTDGTDDREAADIAKLAGTLTPWQRAELLRLLDPGRE